MLWLLASSFRSQRDRDVGVVPCEWVSVRWTRQTWVQHGCHGSPAQIWSARGDFGPEHFLRNNVKKEPFFPSGWITQDECFTGLTAAVRSSSSAVSLPESRYGRSLTFTGWHVEYSYLVSSHFSYMKYQVSRIDNVPSSSKPRSHQTAWSRFVWHLCEITLYADQMMCHSEFAPSGIAELQVGV